MRVFGHPLHAVLVAFPIGLLTLVPCWDALALLGVSGAGIAGYLSEIAGLIAGVLALLTGSIDFALAKKSEAVENLGLLHATAAVTALSVFAVALVFRSKDHGATLPAVALEAAGVVCLSLAGWCGGHLVFHHGVGVRRSERDGA
ncbi:MAG TPA: DUF2231 domain-containing protein [Polyangiaceae bacterium]|nr:DUF2231 domain-containing protein [Polyangiaceae bacterium]